MKTLVSVSYCAEHRKGGDAPGAPHVPPQEHAEWLEQACDLYLSLGYDVVVSCTGYRGILNVEQTPTSHERDVMWRVIGKVKAVLGDATNPGHQVGAALCIRQGLEAAGKWGYEYLIHTAEDVLPTAKFAAVKWHDKGIDYEAGKIATTAMTDMLGDRKSVV